MSFRRQIALYVFVLACITISMCAEASGDWDHTAADYFGHYDNTFFNTSGQAYVVDDVGGWTRAASRDLPLWVVPDVRLMDSDIVFAGAGYVVMEDGDLWEYDGVSWSFVAVFPGPGVPERTADRKVWTDLGEAWLVAPAGWVRWMPGDLNGINMTTVRELEPVTGLVNEAWCILANGEIHWLRSGTWSFVEVFPGSRPLTEAHRSDLAVSRFGASWFPARTGFTLAPAVYAVSSADTPFVQDLTREPDGDWLLVFQTSLTKCKDEQNSLDSWTGCGALPGTTDAPTSGVSETTWSRVKATYR